VNDYVTPAVTRQFQASRAYRDLRVVLDATWPSRWRPIQRARHREAIRRLVLIARRAGVNVHSRECCPDCDPCDFSCWRRSVGLAGKQGPA